MRRHRLLVALIRAGLVLLPASAAAVSLGGLTLGSAAGQPLKATIALEGVGDGELDGLRARIAPEEAFRQARLPVPDGLAGLPLQVARDAAGRPVLVLSAASPAPGASLDLLIELTSPSGHSLVEYPVPLAAGDQVVVVAPRAPTPQGEAAPQAPAAAAPQSGDTPAQSSAARRPPPGRTLRVRRGDTLSGIALRIRPPGVSLEQVLAALYDANPDAFSGHNMNRLQSGRILRLPAAGDLARVDPAEAAALFTAHEAAWQRYRQALARAPRAMAGRAQRSGRSAAGRIDAAERRPAASSDRRDVLRLSRGDEAARAHGGDRAAIKAAQEKINALQEELAARGQSIQEANARIAELEKTVKDLQRLLSIKDQGLAEMQRRAQAAAAKPAPAPAAAPRRQEAVRAAKPHPAKDEAKVDTSKDVSAAVRWAIGLSAGLLALLVGGAGWLWLKRRKPDASPGPFQTALEQAQRAEPPAEPAAEPMLDPLEEAKRCMDDGRLDEAERLLTGLVAGDPGHTEALLLLLQLQANRRNAGAFEALARQYAAQHPGAEGPDWPIIASMGRTIDPGNPLYQTAPPEPAVAAPAVAASAALELPPEPDVVPEPVLAAPAPRPDLEAPAISLDEIPSFTLGAAPAAAAVPAEAGMAPGVDLDFSFNMDAAPAAEPAPAAVPAMDFSGIDLDLAADPAADGADAESPQHAEAATKLDLARAYLEMGDAQGARQVLNEVLREGSERQVAEAKQLLADNAG